MKKEPEHLRGVLTEAVSVAEETRPVFVLKTLVQGSKYTVLGAGCVKLQSLLKFCIFWVPSFGHEAWNSAGRGVGTFCCAGSVEPHRP